MNQPPLFTEDILQALDDVIRAWGTYDQVAGQLWPNIKTAYNKLKNKLNPEHHEQFHPEEVIAILQKGRELDVHTAMYFLCDQAGYERPKPAAQKSRLTEILERQAELRAEDAMLSRERDRIEGAETLKSVR